MRYGLGTGARPGGLAAAIRAGLPSLDLDFMQQGYSMGLIPKTFSDLIPLSRPSGGGRINAAGQFEWLASHQPRFDYDPVTLQPKGLLIEELRPNLWTPGNVASGHAGCVRTDAGVASIYPAHTWQRATISSSTVAHHVEFFLSGLAAGSTYTLALDVRRGNFDLLGLWQNVDSLVVLLNLATGVLSDPTKGQVRDLGNGRWRVSCSLTATGTMHSFRLYFGGNANAVPGNGTDYFDYANPQIVQAAFPTSYIPTAGSQVTRAADDAPIVSLSPWFNAAKGTVFARFLAPPASGTRTVWAMGDGTANERIVLQVIAGTLTLTVVDDGVTQAAIVLGAVTPGALVKCAIRFAANDIAGCINGGAVQKDATATIPAVTIARLGRDYLGNYLNSHLQAFTYLPDVRTDAQMQALTA